MTNELGVGLGQDFATHSYLNRVFGPLEEAFDCPSISLDQISTSLAPLSLAVSVDVPAQDYDSRNNNWIVTNAGLRRLVGIGEKFDLLAQENPKWLNDPKTKEIMATFITGANHLAHTNRKISEMIDDETTKKELEEEGGKAIETAIGWAKRYGLVLEMRKNLNDYVVTEWTRCLTLPPEEALKKLALLTMTMSMMIETGRKLGLPSNVNSHNNQGVLYTGMADRFFADPKIVVKGTDFYISAENALKAFSEGDKQLETIEDKESAKYRRGKIMIASNTAQVYILRAEYIMNYENPKSYILAEQIRGFNMHFAVASGTMREISIKKTKTEEEKRIIEFFNSEIYCRGIRALIVIAQYAKQGFTFTEEYTYEKKQLVNLISKFDARPVESLDMGLKDICKYAKDLTKRFSPEDKDDKIAYQKVLQLLDEVAQELH